MIGGKLINREEIKLVTKVLKNKGLYRFDKKSSLQMVAKFEKEFAEKMEVKHALGVTSCTAGLSIALNALDVGPGAEVIVPAYTFIATAEAIIGARAIPVIAEVDYSLNLDPDKLEEKITKKTRAIIVVHMSGVPAKIDKILKIARKHHLFVIEDVAQAAGVRYKGKRLGTFGDAGCFSFDYYKAITTGEGGMIVTDNEDIYRRCGNIHDHGHEVNREDVKIPEVPLIGLNYKMNELQGALGLAQLKKLDYIVKKLTNQLRLFREKIQSIPHIALRELPGRAGYAYHGAQFFLPTPEIVSKFLEKCKCENVPAGGPIYNAGWHYYANWKQVLKKKTITSEGCPFTCPYYGKNIEYQPDMCPQSDELTKRCIHVGFNILNTEKEIIEITQKLKTIIMEML